MHDINPPSHPTRTGSDEKRDLYAKTKIEAQRELNISSIHCTFRCLTELPTDNQDPERNTPRGNDPLTQGEQTKSWVTLPGETGRKEVGWSGLGRKGREWHRPLPALRVAAVAEEGGSGLLELAASPGLPLRRSNRIGLEPGAGGC